MFWDDDDLLIKKKDARIYAPPPIPDTGWKPPAEYPNLDNARVVAFDTETKDLTLTTEGPGWARGKSHIVGASLSVEDRAGNRGSWYFPIRHEFHPHLNMDVTNTLAFLKDTLEKPTVKVGANLTYDIGNLADEGIFVKGPLNDVQFAEALIDNEAYVALDTLSHKYLNKGKTTDLMYEWQRGAYPHTPEDKRRRDIYRTPPELVGFYAEDDTNHPLDIYDKQHARLWHEGLHTVYRLECDLIPLMVAMRRKGVRVDIDKAEALKRELEAETILLYKRIYDEYGVNLTKATGKQLAALFDSVGISYPKTELGAPSFKKEFFAALTHPLGDLINDIREREKLCSTFIQSYILDGNVNGFVYPQFHQLHSEDGGTKVGRFSSSDPNLQNIPSRTKLGKRVRGLFVADEGHIGWRKHDVSQIHYRILAHWAVGNGAQELRDSYNNDAKTDYHMNVYKNVAPLMNWSQDYTLDAEGSYNEEIQEKRRPIKNTNFGLLYGQTAKALAYKMGFTDAQATEFFEAYHKGAPYVKDTMDMIGKEVQKYGYVTTLLGRRIRFHLFEPDRKKRDYELTPLPYEAALRTWGAPLKRAFEYRGVNYKLQGSEPDIMKSGMLACYNSGVFDFTGVPRVTVHDELGFSQIDDSPQQREAFEFIKRTCETIVPLNVPVYIDTKLAANWGKCG